MIRLSVNVNKIATLRNSRGGSIPSVLDAVAICLRAGAAGITVHPRADRRHITPTDVREIAAALAPRRPAIEYNIEGDPRPDLLELVHEVQPDQCTLVPVTPGEITSHAGWQRGQTADLASAVSGLRDAGVRVSVFVDPEPDAVRLAADVGAQRVELYTEPFARAFDRNAAAALSSLEQYSKAAAFAHDLGLGVNAGHDLDQDNLVVFRNLPHLDEVSIGHAIVSRAVFVGLERVVRQYISVLAGGPGR
jgi:pyridoxine 5-phosphate synthase